MTVQRTPVRLLLIEDSEDDAMLIQRYLNSHGFAVATTLVESEAELRKALDGLEFSAIIADYKLPSFSGIDALRIVREKQVDIPFILVSGTIGEDLAVQAMKAGAHDYVMKSSLARLGPALERELEECDHRRERAAAQRALSESEARYRMLLEQASDGIILTDRAGKFLVVNQSALEMLGYTRRELMTMNVRDFIPQEDLESNPPRFDRLRPGQVIVFSRRVKRKGAPPLNVELSVKALADGTIQSIMRDITDRVPV